MSSETQASITAWALETFGPSTPMRSAVRVCEEIVEIECVTCLDTLQHIDRPVSDEEVADAFICLYRLASDVGIHDLSARLSVQPAAPTSMVHVHRAMARVLVQVAVNGSSWGSTLQAAIVDLGSRLQNLAYQGRFDLNAVIDAKMRINRARRWHRDGHGCGYHVREEGKEDDVHPKQKASEAVSILQPPYVTTIGEACHEHGRMPAPDEPCWTCERESRLRKTLETAAASNRDRDDEIDLLLGRAIRSAIGRALEKR